ncbi:MAG: arsenosugar biosynthesis radical SAM protein ArsS [Thermodesulfovibrionales bacterium]|nr:arsenosugar biosynthesis radical SAM protein ArsS [Thermodesulfovibrionales bacterium]
MRVIWQERSLKKTAIDTVQINLGNRCNQRCIHCHIGASPEGSNNMDVNTAYLLCEKLLSLNPKLVEFTGGAPEMNPNLSMFLEKLSRSSIPISVRTNLTILDIPEYSHYIELYKRYGVKVIASLPSYHRETADRQRGKGVFNKSIIVLKKLNKAGYGIGKHKLDLVYNPSSDYLPPSIEVLEYDYRKTLKEQYGIEFNRLITITNSPIGGFKRYLINSKKYEDYLKLLANNFNADTLNYLMCRSLVSVDYLGYVYDCDFNLASSIKIKGFENIKFWEIDFDDFYPEITCAEHCYACTASAGSSCQGALIKDYKDFDVHKTVKKYYGTELKGTKDLKTGACCNPDLYPPHIKDALSYVADEIKQKYYGCGSPIPPAIKGLKVLDIGCGTGRDCYILSKLVGEEGFVYGLDMTKEQIEVAKRYVDDHTKRFGYKKPNIKFIHDYIENLDRHFSENSIDIVVSNCVVNLIEDKEGVIKQIYKILKYGGEFYFSDIYADRRLPDWMRKNPLLYGECLGGALYCKDFERIAQRVGFTDPRVVSKRAVDIKNEVIEKLIENIEFYSITYRLWKIDGLEDACEDYGHIAIYKGGIPESPFNFVLDSNHVFEKDRPMRVCGNTALMLLKTRVKDYFKVIGDFSMHFGAFKGCEVATFSNEKQSQKGCCC